MDLKKIVVYILLILLTSSRLNKNYPDALKCGVDQHYGQVYIMHGIVGNVAYYSQIYSQENRMVIFINGVFSQGYGHDTSRKGCHGKTISDLQKQGRAFDFQNSQKITQLQTKYIKKTQQLQAKLAQTHKAIQLLKAQVNERKNPIYWKNEDIQKKYYS